MRALILCLGLFAAAPALAQNNGLPTQKQGLSLVGAIADQGEACGLLRPWQAQGLRAQVTEGVRRYDSETRGQIETMRQELLEDFDCETPAVTQWIAVAGPNMESEVLPNYLVIYRTLARMETPPATFEFVALRQDYAPAIAAIDAKLEALEASGAVPEGGGPWPDFIAGLEDAVAQFTAVLNGEPAPEGERRAPPVDQIAAYMAQSALITELWLQDSQTSE